MRNKIEIDNIVRISSKKHITEYIQSIFLRGQPESYNKYKCIKLRFTADLMKDVNYLCMLYHHFGLTVVSVKKAEEGIPIGRGVISNVYEVELRKIGAIQFEDDSDYKNIFDILNNK